MFLPGKGATLMDANKRELLEETGSFEIHVNDVPGGRFRGWVLLFLDWCNSPGFSLREGVAVVVMFHWARAFQLWSAQFCRQR